MTNTDDVREYHIERVADNPRKARDLDNLVVVKKKIHHDIHDIHDKGAESFERLKKCINENNYNMPNNLK